MCSAAIARPAMFSDKMFTSTDLNRRSAEVLDTALRQPVTISRNADQFALMPREQAARLYRTVDGFVTVTRLLAAIALALSADGVQHEPYAWLAVYEKDDLQKFTAELTQAVQKILSEGSDWEEVEGVMHAWRESAAAVQSGVLDHAMFTEEAAEQPLPSAPDESGLGA
ncbi:hypothetical protein [uncultured Paludibaculum sp.]|uniref:hypothetical protein n=1 Tax=uncultured Paludibaculum sp. TaxID=1765020 RepID=UPI002AAB4CC7|nr:hypothetical protein [uncultured Paludibaculum sp.]